MFCPIKVIIATEKLWMGSAANISILLAALKPAMKDGSQRLITI